MGASGASGGAVTGGGLSGSIGNAGAATGHAHAPKVPLLWHVCDPTGAPAQGQVTTAPGTHAAGGSPRLPHPADTSTAATIAHRLIPPSRIVTLPPRTAARRVYRGTATRGKGSADYASRSRFGSAGDADSSSCEV